MKLNNTLSRTETKTDNSNTPNISHTGMASPPGEIAASDPPVLPPPDGEVADQHQSHEEHHGADRPRLDDPEHGIVGMPPTS